MKKNNMKSIGILTGLWLLLFLNCGQRMAAQIRNKVCDTIPYEFIQEKIIIPVTVNGIKVKYIVDTGGRTGTMYDAATAAQQAFSLLTIPTKCPPDLMEYVINNHYIPDAQFPEFGERELVQKNADFIARHSLLYYYRGD